MKEIEMRWCAPEWLAGVGWACLTHVAREGFWEMTPELML